MSRLPVSIAVEYAPVRFAVIEREFYTEQFSSLRENTVWTKSQMESKRECEDLR
jgi:hypothetical protein